VSLYWLSILPLAVAGVVHLMGRRQRSLVTGFALLTAVICANLSLTLPADTTATYLGQEWLLGEENRVLLAFMYVVTTILFSVAALSKSEEELYAPMLASAGLLSAVVLVDSLLLSFVLLPLALVVLGLGVPSSARSSTRGALSFLAWVTLPMPFLLAIFPLLEQSALRPQNAYLVQWSAWLVVPPVILWLTLFPLHWTTRLWAGSGRALIPVFLWTVKDGVVLLLLFALWRQIPVLREQGPVSALGAIGLMTAVVSGVLALAHPRPGAVLACAAMSELGIAVQGMMAASVGGLEGGLTLFVSRCVAVLLASSALAGINVASARGRESDGGSFGWRSVVMLVAFSIGVLSMAGMPPLLGFLGRERIYSALQPEGTHLLLAWLSASTGIVLGLVRAVWSAWHSQLRFPVGHSYDLLLLLVLGLLLLCVWIGLFPQVTLDLIADWVRRAAPASCL